MGEQRLEQPRVAVAHALEAALERRVCSARSRFAGIPAVPCRSLLSRRPMVIGVSVRDSA